MAWTTVVTHATGDVLPASDWNTYVRDNLAYLHGDAGAFSVNNGLTIVTGGLTITAGGVQVNGGNVTIAAGSGQSSGGYTTPAAFSAGTIGSAAGAGINPTGYVSVSRAAGQAALLVTVPGDTQFRFLIDTNGVMSWGSGAAAVDTSLSRAGIGLLALNAKLVEAYTTVSAGAGGWGPAFNSGLTQRFNVTSVGTVTVNSPAAPAGNLSAFLNLVVHNASGGSVTLSWNAIFAGSTPTALPASVANGLTMVAVFVWDPGESKWFLVAYNTG